MAPSPALYHIHNNRAPSATAVNGRVTAQHTQKRSVITEDPSLASHSRTGMVNNIATEVAGRNSMVRKAIDFMTALFCAP